MKVENPDLLYGLSVSLIGASGVVFPLFISPYVDRTKNIHRAIMLINITGIIGNLMYGLPFSPVIVLLGQFFAGTTPAFGVLAMGETSRTYSPEILTKKISVLSLIYSVGTFTSIGLVFVFLYIDFWIGWWHINFAVMPGLFMAFAFVVSMLLSFILVTDVSKEYDLKLEERIKRSSCASTPLFPRSEDGSPEPSDSNRCSPKLNDSKDGKSKFIIPKIIEPENCMSPPLDDANGQNISKDGPSNDLNTNGHSGAGSSLLATKHFGLPVVHDQDKDIEEDTLDADQYSESSTLLSAAKALKSETYGAAKDTVRSVIKILRYRTTALLMFVTFVEAFIYSLVVTSLPVLATKYLNWGKVELALLSMVNKFLSVLISGSVYFLTDYFEDFLLLIYGIEFSLMALLSLSVLELVEGVRIATTILLFLVATLAIAGIPLIITSTRSMLAKLVPSEVQSLTEAVRMSVFEASFVPSGFLVPLVTLNLPATVVGLLIISLIVVTLAILEKNALVHPREEDEYWHPETTSSRSSRTSDTP